MPGDIGIECFHCENSFLSGNKKRISCSEKYFKDLDLEDDKKIKEEYCMKEGKEKKFKLYVRV